MNKFLRLASTLVVGNGLILLLAYLFMQNNVQSTQILDQPSYYTLQNYWYLFLAGCGCVAFSIISCFLAWNKKLDTQVEVLPNAVAAEKNQLLSWLSGSSLDTARKEKAQRLPEEIPTQQDGTVSHAPTQEDTVSPEAATEGDTVSPVQLPEDTTTVPDAETDNTFIPALAPDTDILDDGKTELRPR